MRDNAPLAGNSGVTDAFSGAFESSTSLCTYLCMFGVFVWPSSSFGRSACCLGLLVGETGCFESIWRIPTCLYVSPAIFACTPSPCVAMRMFSLPVASGLDVVVSPGKSRVCTSTSPPSQHVDRLPKPSVTPTSRLALPAFGPAPVPLPLPIAVILTPSRHPLDLSIGLLGHLTCLLDSRSSRSRVLVPSGQMRGALLSPQFPK